MKTIRAVLRRTRLRGAALSIRRRIRAEASRLRLRRWQRRHIETDSGFDGERRVVLDGDGPPTLARIQTRFRANELRSHNLGLATTACEELDAVYFDLVASRPTRSRVGVVAEKRDLVAWLERHHSDVDLRLERPPSDRCRGRELAARGGNLLDGWTDDTVLVLSSPICDRDGHGVHGQTYGCEIDIWTTRADGASGPTMARAAPDALAPVIPSRDALPGSSELPYPEFAWAPDRVGAPWPIDVVVTWVDGYDRAWLEKRAGHVASAAGTVDGTDAHRYRVRDELRASLRSIWYYAPYVDHIYLVTDGQVPEWLDPESPLIDVVDHGEIFSDDRALPVFNSHAIESQLHHIDGLSEHYLYFNDDVFLGRLTTWVEFFTPDGRTKFAESASVIPFFPDSTSPSVDHAGSNTRELLHAEFGWASNQKIQHIPHPQRRSMMFEIERRFPDVVERVSHSRFRSTTDVSIASNLSHRFAEAMGQAIAAPFDYGYINLARPDLRYLLDDRRRTEVGMFCLNDSPIPSNELERVDGVIDDFLRSRFPFAAPWERA